MRDITVLVTAAGNAYMPGITDCLNSVEERNVRLVGADMNDDPSMLDMFDVCYQVPRGDDPRYVDVIFDICVKENVDVVLPIMSVELMALSRQKERFQSRGIIVSVSDADALAIANNKILLLDMVCEKGLPCADYHIARSVDDLVCFAKKLGYPEKQVCVKRCQGSGSRGFRMLSEGYSAYDAFLNEKPSCAVQKLGDFVVMLSGIEDIPEMLMMEYLPGDEYTVDLLADHGNVLAIGCRRATQMNTGIMLGGVVDQNPDAIELCTKVVESLGLHGNIGFDLRAREDGTILVMECNPRITAGIPLFKAAGLNLIYLCVKMLLGESFDVPQATEGTHMVRRYSESYY